MSQKTPIPRPNGRGMDVFRDISGENGPRYIESALYTSSHKSHQSLMTRKHSMQHWPFVRVTYRPPVYSPHKWTIVFVCFRFLFVCFITKSFLTYSFVVLTPTLSTIYRPLSSYVSSITPETAKVGSSYSHMRGPGVSCWFSDRSNCSHYSFEAAMLLINPNIYID